MRRSLTAFLALALSCALLLGPISLPASAEVAPQAIRDFTISGTGYGHGIGMSQYGAQGYALKGYTYGEILAHYYQKTSLKTLSSLFGSKDSNPQVKVNIDKSKSYRVSWTIKGYKSDMVASGGGTAVTLGTNTYYKFTASAGKVIVNGKTLTSPVTVTHGTGSLLVVKDASGPFSYADVRYRGKIVLTASGSTLKAVNQVAMEEYLYGVVPRESPASWKAEALKAQAVAARSYAWGTNPDGDRNGTLDGELACTTSSQVYGAHSRLLSGSDSNIYMHEDSRSNAAVDATKGKVVTYGSTVITTYFFSQSGGRTANIQDVWVASAPKPYYTSVSDPYENLAGAGYCPWPPEKEKHLDGLELANALRDYRATHPDDISAVPASPNYVTGVSIERAASGYPRYVTFRFSNGSSAWTSGWSVRSAFGLLSPMFYFSGFPISRIYSSDRYGTAVSVSRKAFPTTANAVVVASGEDFADALTGSGVAGTLDGSLLLSRRGTLPGEVAAELRRLAPTKVYLMGGTGALASAVESAVKAAVPGSAVARIAGTDRYDTAAKAARVIDGIAPPAKVLLASGVSWPDAAASSAMAYARKYPILLTRQATLSAQSSAALKTLKPATVVVAGSEGVVSKAVANAAIAASGGSLLRLGGHDRYATSAAIARYLVGGSAPEGVWTRDEVYMATGDAFPDALTGGVLAGRTLHAMLLTRKSSVSGYTESYLKENRLYIVKLWIFGGTGAVSDSGFAALDSAMMN